MMPEWIEFLFIYYYAGTNVLTVKYVFYIQLYCENSF